jgi:hypothetical protein
VLLGKEMKARRWPLLDKRPQVRGSVLPSERWQLLPVWLPVVEVSIACTLPKMR